ncbi:unnamed protein product [Fraxinus pennsylvanica]|uniref:MSP domain-containing protein n=1 Tax=Fraxinus pennsylvanica TaxID=56036 RepID=A0AAD1ZYT9_9LAMI|nr:unnamed protein product [Fraxinus pennsylvanica]
MHIIAPSKEKMDKKVVTPNSQNYGCEPNRGILSPRSTCHLTVTMQALEEAPRNMQCENKFLIQSLVVSSGATIEDVEILFDEEGHRSQSGLLNAKYIFPPQVQSVVPEGIVSSSLASEASVCRQSIFCVKVAGTIIVMLAIIFLYIVKKTLLLIWSLILLFIMLMIKLISQSALDAIKDWISDILSDTFVNPLCRRLQDIIVHGFKRNRDRDTDRDRDGDGDRA